MKLTSADPRRSLSPHARVRGGRSLIGSSLIGMSAVAVVAACGAGGDESPPIEPRQEGVGPMIGGGASRGNDPSNPLVGSNCKGAACDLAGGGGPLTAPPGCGDG